MVYLAGVVRSKELDSQSKTTTTTTRAFNLTPKCKSDAELANRSLKGPFRFVSSRKRNERASSMKLELCANVMSGDLDLVALALIRNSLANLGKQVLDSTPLGLLRELQVFDANNHPNSFECQSQRLISSKTIGFFYFLKHFAIKMSSLDLARVDSSKCALMFVPIFAFWQAKFAFQNEKNE